jgi:uncharacterized repeat protein (TIGR03803 family)
MKRNAIGQIILASALVCMGVSNSQAQYKTIYNFGAFANDGVSPVGNLVSDAKHNLYGVTESGGKFGKGTAYELIREANGTWTEKILYEFGAAGDGQTPEAGLLFDSKGNLYGTTFAGGPKGGGTVFELAPAADGERKETIIYSFDGAIDAGDGYHPMGGLTLDGKGNLWGTTSIGSYFDGPGFGGDGCGTVFVLTPGVNGTWTPNDIYDFTYSVSPDQWDGCGPSGSLAFDRQGNIYGTTISGGSDQLNEGGSGTLFRLSQTSAGWTETPSYPYVFGTSGSYGSFPAQGVIADANGNLYGTTSTDSYGNGGTVFQATYESGLWNVSTLYGFPIQSTDGAFPGGGLALDANGNLYGTTTGGGLNKTDPNGFGTVFELTPNSDGSWGEKILYRFGASDTDGIYPESAVTFDPKGNLYGTAAGGGAYNKSGTVFEIEFAAQALPVFFPAPGKYHTTQTVRIVDSTPHSEIYYTTDGSAPTTSSTPYTGPFEVSSPETIRAIAVSAQDGQSAAVTGVYSIGLPTVRPVISPASGIYKTVQTVEMTDSTAGAAIYYTTNGSEPTTSSRQYTGPIQVTESETIKAIAKAPGYLDSAIASAAYLLLLPRTATPAFSVKPGTYAQAQLIQITDGTAGSTIYYTTNGATPTTSSKRYTARIPVSTSLTLKAIAVAKGHSESGLATAAYTIQKP